LRILDCTQRPFDPDFRRDWRNRSANCPTTILRASWFFQNFSEAHFLGPILQGELALPVGHIAEPFIDAEDLAEIAVEALTKSEHSGRLYELTGPRVLTFAEAVDERRWNRKNFPHN
jgi:uncharacterized protein YbjT (DUF2867 family)